MNLAKHPASTVQILGAEKALFRALKTRGKTPKYGLLFHSTFIGRAGAVHKGRISRFLANKCSIASRLDCFSEFPNSVFGEHLRGQVEERLKFFESGDVPRKNVDVMKEALDESNLLTVSMLANAGNNTTMEDGDEGGKKKKKKKKKGQAEVSEVKTEEDDDMNGNGTLDQSKKKKKKKVKQEEDADESALAEAETVTEIVEKGKKKKKRKSAAVDEDEEDEGETLIKVKVEEDSPKKKKKKMK
jgi:nucleolar protein 56